MVTLAKLGPFAESMQIFLLNIISEPSQSSLFTYFCIFIYTFFLFWSSLKHKGCLRREAVIWIYSGWHDHSVIVFQNQVISMYKSIPDSRFSASWEGKKLKLWLSTSLAYLLSYVIYGSIPESSLFYVWVYSRFKNLS